MVSIDTAFSRSFLASITGDVRRHFPAIKIMKDAWVYHYRRDHWEFHGPESFYWHGSAANAYDARAKGWLAWLRHKGVEL